MNGINQGSLFRIKFVFSNEDGSPLSLAGGVCTAVLSESLDHQDPFYVMNSTDQEESFDMTSASLGIVTVKYPGLATEEKVFDTQIVFFAQLQVVVGEDQYRSNVVSIPVTKSVM